MTGIVPQSLIIGRGRMARHLAAYMSLLGLPFDCWNRGQPLSLLSSMSVSADRVFVLITDSAIEPFIVEHLAGTTAAKIHCSGALVTDAAVGVHPLMTFGPDLYTEEAYRRIPFVVDDGAPDTLLAGFPNTVVHLPRDKKPLYHALCVLAGNFSCLLWQRFFEGLENDLGLSADIGLPYLQQQAENIIHDYKTALTGPLTRGDTVTLQRNIDALGDDPYAKVFQSFVTAYQERQKK